MNLGCISAAIFAAASLVSAKIFFEDNFNYDGDDWQTKWKVPSNNPNSLGQWELSSGKFFADERASQGLRTLNDLHFYALTAPLKEPFNNEKGDLVVQFSVKNEQTLNCGGAYIKLMSADIDPSEFSGQTPYKIMFGPDVCGSTRRVHLILERDGQGRMLKKQVDFINDDLTHMYTASISQPSQTYRIHIDGKLVAEGNIADDFEDIGVEPSMIPDPKAAKPADWVDEATIPDPEDKKPEDWDENEEWSPRVIDNPKYKGEWTAPLVPNPDYKKDPTLAVYKNLGHIGFDLWQVNAGTIFDNILVTDSIAEAQKAFDTLFAAFKDREIAAHKAFHAAASSNAAVDQEAQEFQESQDNETSEDTLESDSNDNHSEL